jgi:hypothetical protein
VLGDELVWRSAVEHALAPGIVGRVEAAQQLFEGMVRVDVALSTCWDELAMMRDKGRAPVFTPRRRRR